MSNRHEPDVSGKPLQAQRQTASLGVLTREYFIDIDDGETRVRDDSGRHYAGAEAARAEAQRVVREIVFNGSGNFDSHIVKATVRDDDGKIVYVATVALSERSLV